MYINSNPKNVSWFSSSQSSLPSMMGGSQGDILKVLDACLIDGGPELPVLTTTQEGELVTFSFATGHVFLNRQIITIKGATDVKLNGNHRVMTATATTATISIDSVVATTGAITAKIAPLGWESMFGGATNVQKRAYRSNSENSLKRILLLDTNYLDNTWYGNPAKDSTKRASVSVLSDMTSITDMSQSLTKSKDKVSKTHKSNGDFLWYQKRGAAYSAMTFNTPSVWKIVGNEDFFYLIIGWSQATNFDNKPYAEVYGFGQYAPITESGIDTTFLMCSDVTNDSLSTVNIGGTSSGGAIMSTTAATATSFVNIFDGETPNRMRISPITTSTTTQAYSTGMNGATYPGKYGESIFTFPCRIHDGADVVGVMPSMQFIDNKIGDGHDGQVVDDIVLVQLQEKAGTTPIAASIGFYLGA